MLSCTRALALACALANAAHAQPPAPQPPADSAQTPAPPDTARERVTPEVRLWQPQAWFRHDSATWTRDSTHIADLPYFTPQERQPAFVQTLGNLGKPYAAWRDGLADRLLDLPQWQDPVFGRYNIHVATPEHDIPQIDTRTPYVALEYAQGNRGIRQLNTTVAHNFGPRWNAALFHSRLVARGLYAGNGTDYRRIWANLRHQGPQGRYNARATAIWHIFRDYFNGGTRRQDPSPDAISPAFFGVGAIAVIDSDTLRQGINAAYLEQMVRLLGHADSAHSRLTLRQTLSLQSTRYRYFDDGIDATALPLHAAPVYPTLASASARIETHFRSARIQALAGASYQFQYRRLRIRILGDLYYDYTQYAQPRAVWDSTGRDTTFIQQAIGQYAEAQAVFPRIGLDLSAHLRQSVSALFRPQNHLALHARQRLPGWSLAAALTFRNLNPTFFQQYAQPRPGNDFRANDSLRNQQLTHLEATLARAPKPAPGPQARPDTALQNHYALRLVAAQAAQLIYYTTDMQVQQAQTPVWWGAASVHVRQRLWRAYYADIQAYAQRGFSRQIGTAAFYTANVPALHGRASLYYDNRNLQIAAILRIGIDFNGATTYLAHTLDLPSGESFPTQIRLPAYLRADPFMAAQIHHAYVWIRLLNANDGLMAPGYYTTPFYPAMPRTFMFGVQWRFFD